MARSANHREPLDPRWELVETRNATGRMLLGKRPLIGSVFGSLTVLHSGVGNRRDATCRCVCGSTHDISVRQLWRGQSLQCALCASKQMSEARRRDHDIIPDDALRNAWADRYKHMVRRCTEPTDPAYGNYGGRGIKVCGEWLADRREFFRYATTLPRWTERGLDLDRERNEGDYEPGNIRLVERLVNSNNTRSTRIVQYAGRSMPLSEFWRTYCPKWSSRNTVRYYLDQGRTTEWIVEKHSTT